MAVATSSSAQDAQDVASTSANPYGTFADSPLTTTRFRTDDNLGPIDTSNMSVGQDYGVAGASDVNFISYSRLLRNFFVVPVLSIVEFGVTILLLRHPRHAVKAKPDLIAFVLGLAFWSLTRQLGVPIYRLFVYVTHVPHRSYLADVGEVSSALSHVAVKEVGRLAVVVLLVKLRKDTILDVLWAALGWAAGEVAYGITQNYLDLAQYREVMARTETVEPSKHTWQRGEGEPVHVEATPLLDSDMVLGEEDLDEDGQETIVEKELESLASLKARMELEGIYGVPIPDIPPIIFAVQWLDALLLSLGLTLIISHSFTIHRALVPSLSALVAAWIVHSCLGVLYALAMPKIGVHAVNYFGLLVSMGTLLVGLGIWGVLE